MQDFLLFVSLVQIVLLFLLILYQIYYLTPYKIPFVRSKFKKIVPKLEELIKKYVDFENVQSFVELGAGNAQLSYLIERKFAWQSLEAVEGNLLLVIFVQFCNLFKPKTKVKLLCKNIFDYQIAPNSVIYCYLSQPIMKRLYQEKRLENCLVFSLQFPIENVETTQKIEFEQKSKFQKYLFVYDFRTANPKLNLTKK